MRTILLAVAVLILASVAGAQTIGGVNAPDAIALRITSVAKIEGSTVHSKAEGKDITAWDTGNKIVAVTLDSKIRYTLHCEINHREEVIGPYGDAGRTDTTEFEDGVQVSSITKSLDGVWPSPSASEHLCYDFFHVGDVVTFYSLEDLVWLSIHNQKGTFVHKDCWKPYNWNIVDDYLSLMCRRDPSPELIQSFKDACSSADAFRKQYGMPPYHCETPQTYITWEWSYSIDSEEEIAKAGAR